MTTETQRIFEEALGLPEEDRERLVDLLQESLPPYEEPEEPEPGYEEAWGEEIKRRLDDIDSGRVKTIPWSEVREELRARLRGNGS